MLRKISLSIIFFFLLISVAFPALKATIDPLDIGVGTRPLGMGKAFVAAADDTNSIFLNPAGLSNARDWGMNSMYSSLISEVTFTSIGLYRSSSLEGVGMGFVRADVGGPLIITYRDPTTQRIVPTGEAAIGYTSSVFMLSYGVLLGKYAHWPVIENTSLGLSLKLFYQTLTTTESLSASGYDLDVGLIYKYNPWLKFGFYGQNILPVNAGGVLRWNTGVEESIPSSYKLGVNAKILGDDALWMYPQDLFWNFDSEGSLKRERPIIFHTGLEWWPYDYTAFRFGIDQDVYSIGTGNGVDNNMTFGFSLFYGDMGFDYAYHQYGPLVSNTTHYFSISYGYPKVVSKPQPKPKEPEKPKEYLKINEPLDRSVIYNDIVNITGSIMNNEVTDVEINGKKADIARISQGSGLQGGGVFSSMVQVPDLGKFPLTVKCFDNKDKVLAQYMIRLVRFPSFSDVPESYWSRNKISLLAMLNLFGGYPDGTFRPEKEINRAELTTLLVRASGVNVPIVKGKIFKDIDSAHWAAKYVKVGVDRGIVTGYRDKTFKPSNTLNRAEGLIMIARFAGLQQLQILADKPFPDVPIIHWSAKMIYAAKTEGILDYLSGKMFEPGKSLTRAEAAEMLSKTKFVKAKEAELLDWDKGFEEPAIKEQTL